MRATDVHWQVLCGYICAHFSHLSPHTTKSIIKSAFSSLFQVIAHHPMQSISFASGGDTVSASFSPPPPSCLADCTLDLTGFLAGPMTEESTRMLIQLFGSNLSVSNWSPPSSVLQDTPDYVAYVAKDPVNQRGLQNWIISHGLMPPTHAHTHTVSATAQTQCLGGFSETCITQTLMSTLAP